MHAFGLRVDPESTAILFDGVVTNLLILDAEMVSEQIANIR